MQALIAEFFCFAEVFALPSRVRIETMFKPFTVQETAHLARGDACGFLGSLLAGASHVRRHNNVPGFEQARVRRYRLLGKYVEAGYPELAVVKASHTAS
jgi:hypothetical protein